MGFISSLKTCGLLGVVGLSFIATGSFASAQDVTCAEGERQFEHSLGTLCIPETVERVVALEWSLVEALLAVGIQPVGVADIEGYNAWVKIPVTLDETVPDVGTRQEPNLELIATLNPDLILAAESRVVNNYEALNAIAPTMTFNPYPVDMASQYDDMLNSFRNIAAAVNREEEAETVLADMEAYFDAVAEVVTEAELATNTFVIAQTFPAGDVPAFRLFTDNALAVQVLQRIGLENIWDAPIELYGFTQGDIEPLADIPDTNFFYVAQADFNDLLVALPLWQAHPAVAAGHAYWLGGDVWFFGGPLSAEVLVETILNSLGIEPPVLDVEATPEVTPEVTPAS